MALFIVTFISNYGLYAVALSLIALSAFLYVGMTANSLQRERPSGQLERVRITCIRASSVSLVSLMACMLLTFFAFHLTHPGVPM